MQNFGAHVTAKCSDEWVSFALDFYWKSYSRDLFIHSLQKFILTNSAKQIHSTCKYLPVVFLSNAQNNAFLFPFLSDFFFGFLFDLAYTFSKCKFITIFLHQVSWTIFKKTKLFCTRIRTFIKISFVHTTIEFIVFVSDWIL